MATATSVRNRTAEFQSIVDHVRASKPAVSNEAVRRRHAKSEFSKLAATIGIDIRNTSVKLEKLTNLAQRRTLFDDPTAEIQDLTMMVKQDIAQLNGKLDQLTKLRDTHSSSKQVVDHSTNVVNQLKSSLMTTTQSFQEVLKTRTDSMQAQQDRRQQFLGTQAQSRARPSPFQANGHSSQSASSVAIDLGSGSAGAEEAAKGGRNNALSLSLMEARPEQGYQQARADAVRQVESTIVELGQIFNQLATMVAEQVRILGAFSTEECRGCTAVVLSANLEYAILFPCAHSLLVAVVLSG